MSSFKFTHLAVNRADCDKVSFKLLGVEEKKKLTSSFEPPESRKSTVKSDVSSWEKLFFFWRLVLQTHIFFFFGGETYKMAKMCGEVFLRSHTREKSFLMVIKVKY